MILNVGDNNDRWEVMSCIDGRCIRYVFKCKKCGMEKTASKQLFDRGRCDCEHKAHLAEYKKEYYKKRIAIKNRLKVGESNERWKVKGYVGGRYVRYVLKCQKCSLEKTATRQLFDRGRCDCERKVHLSENKKECKEMKTPNGLYAENEKIPICNYTKLPKILDKKGVRNLLHSMLNQALTDGKKKQTKTGAEVFVKSDWCKEICENIEIDYQRYVDTFYRKCYTEAGKVQ